MTRIEEIFDVAAPIARVYDSICNVGEIGYVVAGVQKVDVLSEDESDWKVLVKAGMISQTMTLRGTITSREPPRKLTFRAEGRNVSLDGLVELEAGDAGVTHCRVVAQSEVTGRLAPLINLIARTTQKQLIAETVSNFRKKLSGSEIPRPA
ncbi:hypothetical protein BH10PSE7_BH10PSE7_13330 [soil metagenome]